MAAAVVVVVAAVAARVAVAVVVVVVVELVQQVQIFCYFRGSSRHQTQNLSSGNIYTRFKNIINQPPKVHTKYTYETEH